ncbi:IS3 family transposase [Francisella halioticida]|uniref:IS3 family transposase n=1 Tax=Francisella halioticida TaxID=549298 RepID=A0ABM6LY84_9GAMM|nr:IS3 family transposase [Francisella halioticida]ASG67529.1 IS3 family transposase [Francisella halioticida]
MSNKRKIYTVEFKTKVVLEVLGKDQTITQLSVKYNITPKNINNWKTAFLENAELVMDPSKSVSQYKKDNAKLQTKIDQYSKKVGQLTIEKEFLEVKLVSLGLSDRKAMIDPKHKLSVVKQSCLLEVSRAGLYYKPVVNEHKEEVKAKLIQIHEEIPCYGYIKAHKQLIEDEFSICENTVQKYRKELGIKAILAVKKPNLNLSEPNKEHAIYSYKLKGLSILRPNQVWSTDITYIKTDAGTVYMAAIIDWYSKAVLSWEISNTMDSSLVMKVLNEALYKYGVPEIFNTDQGSQYTSNIHIQTLLDKKITISMDGKGRATDNICIERFWRSAKCERFYLNQYPGIVELRNDVDDYIDFYNNRRFHESINYKKPMEFYYDNLLEKRAA